MLWKRFCQGFSGNGPHGAIYECCSLRSRRFERIDLACFGEAHHHISSLTRRAPRAPGSQSTRQATLLGGVSFQQPF